MNTAQRIFRNTAFLGLARFLQISNSIVLAFLIARALRAEGLGAYSTALAFYGITMQWVDLGIFNFISREVARDLSRTNRYMINLGVLSTAVTIFVMAGLCVVAHFINYSQETTLAIYVVSLALIPASLNSILEAVMITHEKAEFITFSQFIGNLGDIVGSVFLLASGYGVVALIVNFVVCRYLTLAVRGYFLVRHILVPRWEFQLSFLKSLVGQLKHFTLLGIVGSFFVRETEIVILSIFVGDVYVGYYSAALKLVTVWYIIPSTLLSVVFPHLSKSFEQSKDKFAEIQNRSVKYLMVIALPLAVGLLVVGDQIIRLFYGPGFEEAMPVLKILAWMPILFFLSGVLWRTLLARDQQSLALRVLIISLLIRVTSACVLIMAFGYLGAPVALIATYIIYVFLHLHYVWKGGTPIPFFRVTWRFILATMVMGAFSWFMGHQAGVHLFANVAISILFYVGLVFVLQGFAQEDIELFRKIIHRGSKSAA